MTYKVNNAAKWMITISLLVGAANAQSKNEKGTPDNWERSKECAAQAEKVMKWLLGNDTKTTWQNHYSPKYKRCFVTTWRERQIKDWNGTVSETDLYDAFERAEIASSITVIPESTRFTILCRIDDKEQESHEDCKAAADFISDHMKN